MKTKDKIANNLKEFVIKRRAELELKTGKKVTIKSILLDLTDYCGYEKFDTINMIYRGVNNPSLYTALKIARYFDTHVEDIFNLKEDNGRNE